MWFTKKRPTATLAPTPVEQLVCRATLVVHADGTLECDDHATCGAEELLHEWWLPCDELGCACLGEEHDLEMVLAAAA
jgi:hypothetical protein